MKIPVHENPKKLFATLLAIEKLLSKRLRAPRTSEREQKFICRCKRRINQTFV